MENVTNAKCHEYDEQTMFHKLEGLMGFPADEE
jgi:hypothetical protein